MIFRSPRPSAGQSESTTILPPLEEDELEDFRIRPSSDDNRFRLENPSPARHEPPRAEMPQTEALKTGAQKSEASKASNERLRNGASAGVAATKGNGVTSTTGFFHWKSTEGNSYSDNVVSEFAAI